MGDVAFTLERPRIDDDVLVVAGDNLFDYSLADFTAFWRSKGVASAVAVLDVGDLRLASQYGVVDVADDERITSFVEKPADPPARSRRPRPTSITASTSLWWRDTSPKATRPTRWAASSPGCIRASRSLRTGFPAGGSTSATRNNSLPRTIIPAASRVCRSAPRTRSRGPLAEVVKESKSARSRDTLVTSPRLGSSQCCSTSCSPTVVPGVSCRGLRSAQGAATR